jgi:sterol desaturase/sphingolipid hydroxylase (fatty acid hydroxylase superfamily)
MFFSLVKGLSIGVSTLVIGYIGDNTISKKTTALIKENDLFLYNQAMKALFLNLLVVSPIVYAIVDYTLINHNVPFFLIQLDKIGIILLVENIGYYFVHKTFHEVNFLYKYHSFHHKFDKILIPSLGQAVSVVEYCTAYLTPFIIGAWITNPSEISFMISIVIIGLLNMIIHCQELYNVKYPFFLVSPHDHIEHHKVRNKHFAAPFINVDKLLK